VLLGEGALEHYATDGYLVLRGVLAQREIEALREACDAPGIGPESRRRGADEKLLHLLEATARDSRLLEIARDERLTLPVSQLLGPDLVLQHSKLATKPPVVGRGEARWHQDFAFFPHTNSSLLAAMLWLDDASSDNGCLHVLPGSHLAGPLAHDDDGYFSGACSDLPADADARQVALPVRAGDVTLHHCLALHRSPENTSGQPRRALVLQYRAADAYQLGGDVWVDSGLVVRGRASQHVRCDAVRCPLPRRRGLDHPFGSAYQQEGGYARAHNLRIEHAPAPGAAGGKSLSGQEERR